jgi:hypothetical protein
MSNIDGRGAEGAAEIVMHLNKPYNYADIHSNQDIDSTELEEIQRPQV